MFEIAGLTIACVSALGTLVQAVYTAKLVNKDVSDATIRKSEERASDPLKTGIKRVSEVIDKDLLEILQNEIETQMKKLIETFRSSSITDEHKTYEVEEARIAICKFLSQVMKFNDGYLPTKRLQNLWASNKCKL